MEKNITYCVDCRKALTYTGRNPPKRCKIHAEKRQREQTKKWHEKKKPDYFDKKERAVLCSFCPIQGLCKKNAIQECHINEIFSKLQYKNGGLYLATLWRDNYKCQNCGTLFNLIVHHKDSNRENNKTENLQTVCWTCHAFIHRNKN